MRAEEESTTQPLAHQTESRLGVVLFNGALVVISLGLIISGLELRKQNPDQGAMMMIVGLCGLGVSIPPLFQHR